MKTHVREPAGAKKIWTWILGISGVVVVVLIVGIAIWISNSNTEVTFKVPVNINMTGGAGGGTIDANVPLKVKFAVDKSKKGDERVPPKGNPQPAVVPGGQPKTGFGGPQQPQNRNKTANHHSQGKASQSHKPHHGQNERPGIPGVVPGGQPKTGFGGPQQPQNRNKTANHHPKGKASQSHKPHHGQNERPGIPGVVPGGQPKTGFGGPQQPPNQKQNSQNHHPQGKASQSETPRRGQNERPSIPGGRQP